MDTEKAINLRFIIYVMVIVLIYVGHHHAVRGREIHLQKNDTSLDQNAKNKSRVVEPPLIPPFFSPPPFVESPSPPEYPPPICHRPTCRTASSIHADHTKDTNTKQNKHS
ncbi:tRNA-dihydrouridine(47) synthase [NAD(P)(+)] [Striga asiatica]|uniref:tRNA-dihydrouridine(47) synthase [NAD(P)(+)] n=1 Tax=Striga asiatica TaxID=4170 RepID=A0A5A7PWT6_STRAF|nr:tRNA-dihydrouridine(47) synthase [NAD(P)(+)] [Striga asiatica]